MELPESQGLPAARPDGIPGMEDRHSSLTEIGEQGASLRYRRLSDSLFELRAMLRDSSAIVYRSDQPADAFLGNSVERITTRPR